jgi:hypothetical protein
MHWLSFSGHTKEFNRELTTCFSSWCPWCSILLKLSIGIGVGSVVFVVPLNSGFVLGLDYEVVCEYV